MQRFATLLMIYGMAALAAPAAAQETPPQDRVEIAEGDGSGNTGRVATNIIAGSSNQQMFGVTVVIGDHSANVQSAEQFMARDPGVDRSTSIAIGPGAFSDNSGLVSVNLTAGTQNQSANLASLTIGTRGVVSDQMLAQASAPTGPAGSPAEGSDASNDTIAISESAFGGNSGLVQMNVIGGERNSSANTFALNISGGGTQ